MPFVKRDSDGRISALLTESTDGAQERLAGDHPEVQAFLAEGESALAPVQWLADTDTDVSRILEDLVELLIAKRVIRFTDLPDSAQEKLLSRRQAREQLQGGGTPVLDLSDLL